MKKLLLLILIAGAVNIFPLPRFALQQQDGCIDCHVNPTGGAMRNVGGWNFGRYVVSMISPRDQDIKISPKIGDNIGFGFDYRTQLLYSQELDRTDFQEMTGALYANVDISPKINVTARYDFVNFLWEGYAVARILPNESYIKVGSFSPYFGLRIDDHTAYTRGGDLGFLATQGISLGNYFTYDYLETGIETGVNIRDIGFLTLSAGKARNSQLFGNDPVYTGRLELTPSFGKLGLLFGGSFSESNRQSFAGGLKKWRSQTYGGFFGLGYDKLAFLAEYDIGDGRFVKDSKANFMMAQASYRIRVGLEAIVRYDMIDPDTELEKDEISRLVLGFEFFPYSFVEVRPQYRLVMEDSDIENDAFVVQFHFWY